MSDYHPLGCGAPDLVCLGCVDTISTHADARDHVMLLRGVIIVYGLSILLSPEAVFGDGGTVCYVGEKDGIKITVLSAPTPLRVGFVDVSLYVQDAMSGAALENATIDVVLVNPKSGMTQLRTQATKLQATNKLFYAATFEVVESGNWDLELTIVHGMAEIDMVLPLVVNNKLPPWRQMWPWFSWPFPVILLFLLIQFRKAKLPQ